MKVNREGTSPRSFRTKEKQEGLLIQRKVEEIKNAEKQSQIV